MLYISHIFDHCSSSPKLQRLRLRPISATQWSFILIKCHTRPECRRPLSVYPWHASLDSPTDTWDLHFNDDSERLTSDVLLSNNTARLFDIALRGGATDQKQNIVRWESKSSCRVTDQLTDHYSTAVVFFYVVEITSHVSRPQLQLGWTSLEFPADSILF